MTKATLVFVHGRSQEGKDPASLKKEWIDALRTGLGPGADKVLAGRETRLPFYGDILDDYVDRAFASPDPAGGRGAAVGPAYAEFEAQVASEILTQHGVDLQAQEALVGDEARAAGSRSPEWLRAIMRLLDGLPGVTGAFIEAVMRDVYVYLNNAAARDAVDRCVARDIAPRSIVVAHSLGSVVAYRLLKGTVRAEVPLFITIGSPLGIGPIRTSLAPRRPPFGVKRWTNAFDDRDDVALYPLGGGRFTVDPPMAIEDIGGLDNRTSNHHGIVEYLNKPAVASVIGSALTA